MTSKPWTPGNASSDAMKDLIRQRLGLMPLQPTTTSTEESSSEEMTDDYDPKDDSGYVCKNCKRCTEFVPSRNDFSKAPRQLQQNKSKAKQQSNGKQNNENDTQRRLTGKRKHSNKSEDEGEDEVEVEEEKLGSVCASCGCGLIHHLVDEWEADHDERDEDYHTEYGDYDDD
eukprot:TRINITY_DN471_c0_g1_i1.p1 TRINITY_DN471_c0_g1~~TRINITY_DN471_c0_g1_i1.p1  ORF type:complete len:172 (-),score=31.51 TRINITY_DN471_c0_g1_i1:79-594(-)